MNAALEETNGPAPLPFKCIRPGGTGARAVLTLSSGVVILFSGAVIFELSRKDWSSAAIVAFIILFLLLNLLYLFCQRIELNGEVMFYWRLFHPTCQFPLSRVTKVYSAWSSSRSPLGQHLVFASNNGKLCEFPPSMFWYDDIAFLLEAVRSHSPGAVFRGTKSFLGKHANEGNVRDEDEKESYLSGAVSRREFWGTPSDLIVWGSVGIGGPLLAIFGMANFPLRNGNDPFYIIGAFVCYALGLVWMLLIRKSAFASGATLPFRMIMSAAMAFPIAMLIYGLAFVLNGKFHWKL